MGLIGGSLWVPSELIELVQYSTSRSHSANGVPSIKFKLNQLSLGLWYPNWYPLQTDQQSPVIGYR